jgi:hypothetical protein
MLKSENVRLSTGFVRHQSQVLVNMVTVFRSPKKGGGIFWTTRATCNFSGSTLLQKGTDLKLIGPFNE